MPGAASRYEPPARPLPAGRMILQRNFEGRLYGFGAARHIYDAGKSIAAESFDQFAERVLGIAREAIQIGMRDLVELPLDRFIDFGMAVAQTVNCRAARRIDIAFACRIIDVNTFAARYPR